MNGMFDFQIFKFVSNKGEDEEIRRAGEGGNMHIFISQLGEGEGKSGPTISQPVFSLLSTLMF